MFNSSYTCTTRSLFLDMHYHFYHQVHRRAADGIHWNPDAVRMQTNIILTHISLSRGMKLPGNYKKFTLPGIHRYLNFVS